MRPEVSVIIPIHNEGNNIYRTIEGVQKTTTGISYEIIVVDDGSTDGSYSKLISYGVKYFRTERQGPAKARNLGAENANGKFLVFLDAHMELAEDWLLKLLKVCKKNKNAIISPCIYDMSNTFSKGYGLTFRSWDLGIEWLPKKSESPYEIPMAGSACLVLSKDTFNSVGGFDNGMQGFGLEEEICIRAWLLGYRILVNPKVEVGHLFRSEFPYEVDNSLIIRNILRVAYAHFTRERIRNVLSAWSSHQDFRKAHNLLTNEVFSKRFQLMKKRKFNDDWFFEKFGILQ